MAHDARSVGDSSSGGSLKVSMSVIIFQLKSYKIFKQVYMNQVKDLKR